jgi:hypothetical protein
VSPAGVPAWIVTGDGTQRIEVPGREPAANTVLDGGPDGSLANLAAAPGGGFTWTHDGAPRASSPTP